jgi:hypothetical protein
VSGTGGFGRRFVRPDYRLSARPSPDTPEILMLSPADPERGVDDLRARSADAPVSAAADPPPAAGPHTLETGLHGSLTVPDGAARAAEPEELSRRAAVYATRAKGDGTRRAYREIFEHRAT